MSDTTEGERLVVVDGKYAHKVLDGVLQYMSMTGAHLGAGGSLDGERPEENVGVVVVCGPLTKRFLQHVGLYLQALTGEEYDSALLSGEEADALMSRGSLKLPEA